MSSARKIIDGLNAPAPSVRSIAEKAQSEADNEFIRLEREVEKGRPISGLARHVYETEKARRDGESDAG